MKICLTVNSSPWSKFKGGGQLAVHQLACALSALDQEVHVVYSKCHQEHFDIDTPYKIHWARHYDVSIMNFLLNQMPERISAVGARPLGMGKPDLAFLTLYYPQGVLGQIHVSWVDSNKERFLRVIGSDARLVFDDLNHLEPIRLFEKGIGLQNKFGAEFGSYDFLLRDGNIFSPKIDQQEPLKLM